MSEKQSKRIILVLGLFSPIVNDFVIHRGMKGVIEAARSSFPNEEDQIITIRDLTDFNELFEWLGTGLENGKYRGLASGFYVQEALEGGHGITDIHYDLTGIDSVTAQSHAGSELRSLIAHVASFSPRRVDIHFRTENGLSSIRRESEHVEGANLPDWILVRLGFCGSTTKTMSGVPDDKEAPEQETRGDVE